MNKFKFPTQIDIKKLNSKVNKKLVNQREETKCSLCVVELKGKCKSFHKSHTVPLFCLENIKSKYKNKYCVLNANYICYRTIFSEDEYVGVNNVGVFYSICSKCDNPKLLENEKSYIKKDKVYDFE